MRLHCLRHGLSLANSQHRFNPKHEDALTDAQARALAATSFDISTFDGIYISPLRRCKETAEMLRITNFIEDARLAERDLGIFEGLTASECQVQFAEAFAAFRTFDADYCIPNGESRASHLARALEWLRDVSHHRRVLAITHGGTIDFLYRLGTGTALHGGSDIFGGQNAAISIFEVNWPSVKLVQFSVSLTASTS